MLNNAVQWLIVKDTKLLLHFLKENHLDKQYFEKIYKCCMGQKILLKTYKAWENRNLSLSRYYINIFDFPKESNDYFGILFNCCLLITHPSYFAVWQDSPWILGTSQSKEIAAWNKVRHDFLETKKMLSFIIKKL